MKRLALINLFLLVVVFLTFASSGNIAFGDNDLTIRNNSEYTLYVAIGWNDNLTRETVTTDPYGGSASSIRIVGHEERLSGWWRIEPHDKYTFDKGSGDFFVNMHVVVDGKEIDQKLPYDVIMYAWVHDEEAFNCITRFKHNSDAGQTHSPMLIDGDFTYDDYLWDKSKNNYKGYRYYFTRNYDGMGQDNFEGCSINKHSLNWLEKELGNSGWVKRKFYLVPENIGNIDVHD